MGVDKPPGTLRLLIAEDSLLVREGLIRLLTGLGHEVVAFATRAEQVLGLVGRYHPDTVLLDVRLPPTFTDEGLRLAVTVRERFPVIGVLVLSQYVDLTHADVLLADGQRRTGYLLKDRVLDVDTLADALRRVADGGNAIDPAVIELLMSRPVVEDPMTELTTRERDVLALMAQGLSDRGIADRLSVSQATVGTHVQNVYRKLRISEAASDNRRVHAVLAYLRGR